MHIIYMVLPLKPQKAMAEWINHKIKHELGLSEKGGLRYSWGYPSCPDTTQTTSCMEINSWRKIWYGANRIWTNHS